jgi:hypothetical protein
VLREWLPLAHLANDPLINSVAAVVGDRDAAAKLLRDVDLWEARHERLRTLATASIPTNLGTTETIALFRREVQHWRGLLPSIWRRHDGKSQVNEQDLKRAREPGSYWSSGVEVRPSRLGASYFLACACEGVANAAARMGVAPEVFRPAILLSTGLRRTPTWVGREPPELESVLEEQIVTAHRVEDLLAEMEVLHRAAAPVGPTQPQPDAEAQAAHEAVMAEMEARRRRRKREQMESECETVPQMFSLWQGTTDLLFRTNLGGDARVEELAHLRHLTFALAIAARERSMPRTALQTLDGILNTLMPREWFDSEEERSSVRRQVGLANVEVQELYMAFMKAPVPTDPGTAGVDLLDGESGPEFTAVERAIVLLLRDGRNPRSTRDYAKEVGASHTTLGRNPKWKLAWQASQEAAKKDVSDLPQGFKDADGTLEAWVDHVCEDCLQEGNTNRVVVTGVVVRLCEACAAKRGGGTTPRTT